MGNSLTRAVVGSPKKTSAIEPTTTTDSAISKLDGQIKILEKRVDHANLLLKTVRQKALTKGQAGDKTGALHDLTRAKQIEKDLTTYHGILDKLLAQRHALEQASFHADTLHAIDQANKHLESTARQMPVERAEEIMEATEEAKQNVEEIQQILVGPPRDTSEEEAELAAMLGAATAPSAPTPIANPLLAPATSDPIQQELAQLAAMEEAAPVQTAAVAHRVAIPN
jgi:hypothetical protein